METKLPGNPSLTDRIIRFCLEQKLVVALIVIFMVLWGIIVAPFDWEIKGLVRSPVSVDAIPDIGENQQIVFTEWMGRSPKDIDDQITYPLTVSLLGIPGVKTIRSYSQFGFSMIYMIFDENVPFESSQNCVIARLNGLPTGTLPEDVKPALGPYATALGQIFWYTLEGRDPDGKPAGGWNPEELRTLQDWTVRYHLQSAEGITEVAPIGGFVQEYQIDADPDAMRAHNVTLKDLFLAVRMSNLDVGARQIELNRVEYLIRAKGFVKNIGDIENTVVKVNDNIPIYIRNVAKVSLGPAMREGALDKGGSEAVGGVVVVRHGYNPLAAIKNVKAKINEISPSLPSKVVADYNLTGRKTLEDFAVEHGFTAYNGAELNNDEWLKWLNANPHSEWPSGITTSKVTIVPFYDRTNLIYETLGTLNSALYEEILITTIVVIIMAARLGVSLLISLVMPLSVFFSFIAMRIFGVEANIVSLSGIAIAIGTIVDMGIIMCQNIIQHLEEASPDDNRLEVVYRAASEVGGAILTAISTTVIGFLPIFTMTGQEGKLFIPLAFTKTFCLIGSVIVGITVIPAAAHIILAGKRKTGQSRQILYISIIFAGIILGRLFGFWRAGMIISIIGLYLFIKNYLPATIRKATPWIFNAAAVLAVGFLLTAHWMPAGHGEGFQKNFILVAVIIGVFQGIYYFVNRYYSDMLSWCLENKMLFLLLPLAIVILGYTAWLGFDKLFGFIPRSAEKFGIKQKSITHSIVWTLAVHKFPGFGKEFMPPLDEGSFLYMPTTMPHASIGEALDIIQKQDMAIQAILEIESVAGKIGRADTALDPAPVNMIETIINYKSEFITYKNGKIMLFRYDNGKNDFVRKDGELIPDPDGKPFRQWRDKIKSPDDIWKEIVKAAEIPGTTTAPKLQPIAARIVMLQSGMRAPMGIKVKGPDLESVEKAAIGIEKFLKEVPEVESDAVIADRIVGKPYLEIDINREAIALYGLNIEDVQNVIEVAIGGVKLTTTVEGRKRFPVRVRYQRELRDRIEELEKILVPAMMEGMQIPLSQLAEIRYVRGPEMIKSEDTFLIGYVLFDKKPGYAEVNVVESCRRYLDMKIKSGELTLPKGVAYKFAGSYENQLHAQKTLALVLPLTLFVIFMIIYFQFRSVMTTSLVFSSIFITWGGGLLMLWLYNQPWFLNFSLLGVNFHEIFQVHPINMSIAIWVGFLALFGIASDDAVVICTYMEQHFSEARPASIQEVRKATVYAGKRRVAACLMTTATTVLALLPVLSSTGRGSDIMIPMSIPAFGGMVFELITMFTTPVLYCWYKEKRMGMSAVSHSWNS